MGAQEWLLLAAVVIVPLLVAIAVTLWTLEQAIKRNRKNQKGRATRRVAEPVFDPPAPEADAETPARNPE